MPWWCHVVKTYWTSYWYVHVVVFSKICQDYGRFSWLWLYTSFLTLCFTFCSIKLVLLVVLYYIITNRWSDAPKNPIFIGFCPIKQRHVFFAGKRMQTSRYLHQSQERNMLVLHMLMYCCTQIPGNRLICWVFIDKRSSNHHLKAEFGHSLGCLLFWLWKSCSIYIAAGTERNVFGISLPRC